MAHELEAPPVLEMLLTRLDELKVVVGPASAPRLGAVREGLTRALALRAAGDVPAATRAIAGAMQTLADIAGALDPAEAAAMRAVAAHFSAALARGEHAEMTRTSEVMRERSGARKVEK
ncbi:MAG: hypothetical protein ABIR79_22705 [Candidatus Binatia bacterium]